MKVYQIKIVIEGSKPPVWRRILIPDRITFYQLHCIIQVAFGWEDEHLHDFTLPAFDIRITDESDNSYGGNEGDLAEDTGIDEFMQEGSWFRYTYDYGDDWRHKIAVEKVIEGYDKRYPQITKYKGGNFKEDSGGIYGYWEETDEESSCADRDGFSIETVNDELMLQCNFAPKKIRNKKSKSEYRDRVNYIEFEKAIGKTMQDFAKLMKIMKESPKSAQEPSNMDLKIDSLKVFFEEAENFTPIMEIQPEQISYEQIILPFIMKKEIISEKKNSSEQKASENMRTILGYRFEQTDISKPYAEVLMDLNVIQLKDYCKYMCQSYTNTWGKKKLADYVGEIIVSHTDYLLILFNEEIIRLLIKIVDKPEEVWKKWTDMNSLINLMSWGFLDFCIEDRQGVMTGLLSVPKEVRTICSQLKIHQLREEYKVINSIGERLGGLMQFYGCIELKALFQKFQDTYHADLTQEDFYRYVYLYGRFNNRLITATNRLTGESLAGMFQLDVEKTLGLQQRYAADIPYADVTEKELNKWKGGIAQVYPEWQELELWLSVNFTITQKELEGYFTELYAQVCAGITAEELIENILKTVHADRLSDKLELWMLAEGICQNTHLAALKGHTRSSFGLMQNQIPIDVISYPGIEKKAIKKDTPVYQMPLEFREMLYDTILIKRKNPKMALLSMLSLMKEYGENHYESKLFLATLFSSNRDYLMSERCLLELKKEVGEDESINVMLKELSEDNKENGKQIYSNNNNIINDYSYCREEPYKRSEKKISPNEPCPCGSGMKYKKCCGRNQ